MKNKKLKAILSLSGYFLLVIALCVSASIVFHNLYYESIYVSGSSMAPTLKGSTTIINIDGTTSEKEGSIVDFGICDTHSSAINKVKRFSIVSTYYVDDYNEYGSLNSDARKKIKRIVALPNETFKIEKSKLYVKENDEFKYVPYTFTTEPAVELEDTCKDVEETTLKENEYWVLGDHRNNSRDSGTLNAPILKSYIIGVLVAIEGRAKLKLDHLECPKCHSKYQSGSFCSSCGVALNKVYDLANKQYHWPRYF